MPKRKKSKEPGYREVCHVLSQLVTLLEEVQPGDPRLWDNVDLIMNLKVSASTLYRWRRDNIIPYRKIGKRFYYPRLFFQQFAFGKWPEEDDRTNDK